MNKQDLINFETGLAKRYDNGEMPYLVHFSGGNEEQLIEIFRDIKPGDWIFSTHRSHYHYLLAGGPPSRLEELILAGKSMFVFDRNLNFFTSSILAGTAGIAAGVAWALRRKGSDRKVWCFLGDGAEDEGNFYEAARYVDSWGLPATFIVEDNNRSVSACKLTRWNCHLPVHFACVRRYHYEPTYPHGGTGSGKWLKFKKKPQVALPPPKRRLSISIENLKERKYKDAIKESMEMLAAAGAIFVGYNVRFGSAYGLLNDVPESQRLETPVAENLMAGLSMGMSLEGFRPVLYFERHDFIHNALDAIMNHMDKVEAISDGQFRFPVIIKAVAGGVYPFYAGLTHTTNMTELYDMMFSFPVVEPRTSAEVVATYRAALDHDGPVLISEPKDLYEQIC